VVVKQPARHGIVDSRYAVIAFVGGGVAAELVFLLAEIYKAAHKKIQPAIIVVVEPDGTRGPPQRGYAGLLRDIAKRPVAVVVVENTAAVLGYVEIGKPIAIVVTDRDSHAVAAAGDASLLCNVGERSVPVVGIQRVAQRRIRFVEVAAAAVDQINIHPAVVVVVDKG